jgi:hypothetical protein
MNAAAAGTDPAAVHSGTDRYPLLLGCGCLLIAIGLLAGGFAAITAVAAIAFAFGPPEMRMANQMLFSVFLYGGTFILFLLLGIGSMLPRRWARDLTLAISTIWLISGVVSVPIMTLIMPQIFETAAAGDPQLLLFLQFATLAFMTLAFIAMPLAFVLVYRSRSVAATVRARDPWPSWTERVPFPVLLLTIWLAISSISMLGFISHNVIPLFGILITGLPAALLSLVLASLLALLAWGIWRQEPAAWWCTLLLMIAGGAVMLPTLPMIDLVEMYEAMGVPATEIEQMGLTDIYRNPLLLAYSAFLWLGAIGALVWMRRYFRSTGA